MVALVTLTSSVAFSFVPEGFENFAILNLGMPSTGVSSQLQYTNPIWSADSESLDVVGNTPLFEDNLLTFGGQATVANKWGDRTAYFLRYDWILGDTTSLSFKWAHADWKYVMSSKDSYGVELNSMWQWGMDSGVYFGFGGYYRLLRQSWDEEWWVPFNSRTKDREGYFTAILGMKHQMTMSSFYTFDINVRDTWAYYGLDNVAWDLAFYLGGRGLYLKVTAGLRTSATWVGTMYPASQYVGFGFVSH